eukprot:3745741-Prymnesium_polylepis.1
MKSLLERGARARLLSPSEGAAAAQRGSFGYAQVLGPTHAIHPCIASHDGTRATINMGWPT